MSDNAIICIHRFINGAGWKAKYLLDKYNINSIGYSGAEDYTTWSDQVDYGYNSIVATITKYNVKILYVEFGTREVDRLRSLLISIIGRFPNIKIILYANDAADVPGFRSHKDKYIELSKIKNIQIYTVDGDVELYAISKGIKNIQWIQQYGLDEFFMKIKDAPKKYDFCFVGSLWKLSNTRLNDLKVLYANFSNMPVYLSGDAQFVKLFPKWECSARTDGIEIKRNMHRSSQRHILCNKAYNQSKIVLCTNLYPNSKTMSVRTPNALLSGSMVLTRYHSRYEEIFTNKNNVVWYKDTKELCDLMSHYIVHEKEREEIAKNGLFLGQSCFSRESVIDVIFGGKVIM